ncbi:MAG: hypothetical protein IPI48_18720 [bacterium]|nr:hypothetical protein [bacterium]
MPLVRMLMAGTRTLGHLAVQHDLAVAGALELFEDPGRRGASRSPISAVAMTVIEPPPSTLRRHAEELARDLHRRASRGRPSDAARAGTAVVEGASHARQAVDQQHHVVAAFGLAAHLRHRQLAEPYMRLDAVVVVAGQHLGRHRAAEVRDFSGRSSTSSTTTRESGISAQMALAQFLEHHRLACCAAAPR